jgi:Spy/CpxP family protein refolding chaperone
MRIAVIAAGFILAASTSWAASGHQHGLGHVLDMAKDLALTPHQHHQTSQAFEEMKAKASALGNAVIAAEEELNQLFANGSATTANVASASGKAAELRGRLRGTHLAYHLQMREILSAEQVVTYNKMRGYSVD